MKKMFLFVLMWSVLLGTSAYAGEYGHKKKIVKKYYNTTNVTNVYEDNKNEFGAKLDAPYLIELRDNWFFGLEGSKDLYNTDFGEGWTSYGKITYTGTLFSFKKGE